MTLADTQRGFVIRWTTTATEGTSVHFAHLKPGVFVAFKRGCNPDVFPVTEEARAHAIMALANFELLLGMTIAMPGIMIEGAGLGTAAIGPQHPTGWMEITGVPGYTIGVMVLWAKTRNHLNRMIPGYVRTQCRTIRKQPPDNIGALLAPE